MLKKDIRKKFKAARRRMSANEQELAAKEIFTNTINSFDLKDCKVSIFLPIERLLEINTWHFLTGVSAEFYLPVLDGEHDLKHIKYESKDQLVKNSWGIPEPTYGLEIEAKYLDFVLVPLLAVDSKGYRVGYGKGFYDRFLSECNPNCKFIGLNYFEPIAEITNVDEFDVPLDACISPLEVVRF